MSLDVKTELCIFDLDGTLIDSLYDLADSMNYALEKNGFPVHDREKYRFMVGSGISVLADRAMAVPPGTSQEKKDAVLADFGSYYRSHCLELTKAYDGIPELLKELDKKGILSCVLSNKPDEFTKKIVRSLFPEHEFADVWGKRDEYPRKPDPTAVNALIRSLGCRNEECLYIGDSDIDMLTAKNAGLRSVGVSWGFRPASELEAAGAGFIAGIPADILSQL